MWDYENILEEYKGNELINMWFYFTNIKNNRLYNNIQ